MLIQCVTFFLGNQHHPLDYDHEPRQAEWEEAATQLGVVVWQLHEVSADRDMVPTDRYHI